ncbi:hypothetical protein CK203_103718 [Vitis vinifera]|uniref:Uncharacterized protein n=1 Tax=Vitis vinifera TaxID=29760 RepID=A0A438D4J4_VITVI|nr:hypothetical protein CK203_103718 [Vitis vinifera]
MSRRDLLPHTLDPEPVDHYLCAEAITSVCSVGYAFKLRFSEAHRRIETTTTPKGLIHMMTVGRATFIVFSDDDLPPEGLDHVRPLYITVRCLGHRVPFVLLDNGSTLNVCSLATAIALGFAPSDFSHSTQTIRAYDNTKREVMGRPWIHRAGAIPSSLHQKVKFIHDGQVITLSDGAPDTFVSMAITLPSPNQASLLSLCFLEEVTNDGVVVDPIKMVSTIEIVEETQTIPVSELLEDDGSLFEATVSPVEERPTLWTTSFL